ncbi:MAG: hypothetical protein M3Z04_00755 [Chloroflexota bacterium]|nr:hypothetical protein [Chloroflexota bacterium]
MNLLLVIPDGTGIRNFLCTDFVDAVLTAGSVSVWHALPPASLAPFQARWGDRVRWLPLPPAREGIVARVLRQAKVYGQLYWQRESGLDLVLRQLRPRGRLTVRVLGTAARLLGRVAAGPRRLHWLDRLHWAAAGWGDQTAYATVLRTVRPDVVFCTHQRAGRAVPALLAARRAGIPTATFIYSWDNLPKGRMAVPADHYLVWSRHMAAEMTAYYPDVAAARVHVVGTPQFEHYWNAALLQPRAAFLARLGLSAERSVICFSGDDMASSPYDPAYLADLAAAVRALSVAQRPQIVFRRSPADGGERYAAVLARYPEITVSDPLWTRPAVGEDWTAAVPTPADVALLANLVAHCDLVVNIGSTMAMDFAVKGKPAIYLRYNPVDLPADSDWTITNIYALPHFRSVHALQPVYWAESAADLGGLVQQVLAQPAAKATARQAWLDHHVQAPLDRAGARCLTALRVIAGVDRLDQVLGNG